MVIVIHPGTKEEDILRVGKKIEEMGCKVHRVVGESYNILGVIGDTTQIDTSVILANDCVERIMRVQEAFKRANRLFHPDDTVVEVGGSSVGGKRLAVMAGPCSVESEEQIDLVAQSVNIQLFFA